MSIKNRRGDTLIEVMFSITVFAVIAVISVGLMNGGIYTAQKSLEVSMARNEIDAQSEALRFIQHSYLAEKELQEEKKEFSALWDRLTDSDFGRLAQEPEVSSKPNFDINALGSCSEAYDNEATPLGQVFAYNAFVLNTRLIQPGKESDFGYADLLANMIVGASGDGRELEPAGLYPRILFREGNALGGGGEEDTSGDELKEAADYRRIAAAQGIWIIAVRGGSGAADPGEEPEYYDFYVRTCWQSMGRLAPSTIGSIVRLYNPEMVD